MSSIIKSKKVEKPKVKKSQIKTEAKTTTQRPRQFIIYRLKVKWTREN
jgi:hypothetical protein